MTEVEMDWRDLIDVEFPEMGPVTEETIQEINAECHRYRGGFRMHTSRIWQDKEFEERRTRVLLTPLP